MFIANFFYNACSRRAFSPMEEEGMDEEVPKRLVENERNAAQKVQKIYRSYRTRRRLADSAVVAEEFWWQALDYARLKHNTISFFDHLHQEPVASRWSRVAINASKIGHGLIEDDHARTLAFQHWIEAIDPRHRYGHNLEFYYKEWCDCKSDEPFFYWLDVDEGRNVDLKECPRSKLKKQFVTYLGPQERKHYEYIIKDGRIFHKQCGVFLDTRKDSKEEKWIFVASSEKKIYAGVKRKGSFHHSSFLAGGATMAAGRLTVHNGYIKRISAHSGHYRPKDENIDSFLDFLQENGVDLREVEVIRSSNNNYVDEPMQEQVLELHNRDYVEEPKQKQVLESPVEEPKQEQVLESHNSDHEEEPKQEQLLESHNGDHEQETKQKEVLESHEPVIPQKTITEEETTIPSTTNITNDVSNRRFDRTMSGLQYRRTCIPQEAILKRIKSRKEMNSYQLGYQLLRSWSTGAGPRIGCVADYPMELRSQALEFVSLAPTKLIQA